VGKILSIMLAVAFGFFPCCRHQPTVASQPDCLPGWNADWGPDSAFALCLPPGFVRRTEHGAGKPTAAWSRPNADGPARDLLRVEILQWPEDSASFVRWPPRLASPPACFEGGADCTTADSVSVYRDSVAGHEARTEVGLLSGGYSGMRREPWMVSGWRISPSRRGFAQGWARVGAVLDTLRMAVRSVRVVQ
jgi:hypothetical protein